MQPISDAPVSNTQIQRTVDQFLEKGVTGLGQVSYLMGEELTLLIQNGRVYEALLQIKSRKQRVADNQWHNLFEPSRMGHVSLRECPGRLLMFEQACFDAPAYETRNSVLNAELENLFQGLVGYESATILSIRWSNARAYVLLAGSNIPLQRVVFISQNEIETDDAALSLMSYWSEPTSEVSLHRGTLESNSWIALHLNILFEFLSAQILAQYGYLTGKVMVNALVRNLVFAAAEHQWSLVNVGNRVQDHTLYNDISDAVTAEKSMLDFIEEHMEAMIGANFIATIKSQSLDPLNNFYINLLRFHEFNF